MLLILPPVEVDLTSQSGTKLGKSITAADEDGYFSS